MLTRKGLYAAAFFLWICTVLTGCGRDTVTGESVLATVGSRTVAVGAYVQALESVKSAYGHNDIQEPGVMAGIHVRTLLQLIDEAVILEAGARSGISVSEEEFREAVRSIRSDYPDDESFQESLLESAVPESRWLDQMRNRMLLEKIVDTLLSDRMTVSDEEVQAYFGKLNKPLPGDEAELALWVRRLKREKAESAYGEWLASLKTGIPISIRAKVWHRVSGGVLLPDPASPPVQSPDSSGALKTENNPS